MDVWLATSLYSYVEERIGLLLAVDVMCCAVVDFGHLGKMTRAHFGAWSALGTSNI